MPDDAATMTPAQIGKADANNGRGLVICLVYDLDGVRDADVFDLLVHHMLTRQKGMMAPTPGDRLTARCG
jgi:hypothetical protein